MRKRIIIGNWKTYKTNVSEVRDYFNQVTGFAGDFHDAIEYVICPSSIHIETASETIPPFLKLGAQDCSSFGKGPYTGDTTAEQLASMGVKYCICGHVERRKYGETDELINGKVKKCIEAGITPIVCFGETLMDYDNDQTAQVIERQMRDSLRDIRDMQKVMLAYMPQWTIGTGLYTSGEYSNIIADFMRKTVVKLTGNPMAANCTIIFAGQITQNNAQEYLECPDVDGIMFAIAALQPKDFANIAKINPQNKLMKKIEDSPLGNNK